MGDMADFAIEQVIDQEDRRHRFHNNEMLDEEAFEEGFLGPNGSCENFAGDPAKYAELHTPESVDRAINEQMAVLGGRGSSPFSFDTGMRAESGVTLLTGKEEKKHFYEILLIKYSKNYASYILKKIYELGWEEKNFKDKSILTSYFKSLKEHDVLAYEGLKFIVYTETGTVLTGDNAVDRLAVKYATERENPTCNQCRNEMQSRHGKYGKFYFCENYCPEQSTVSDAYWQSFKDSVQEVKVTRTDVLKCAK